jgi:dihydropteridine reductase
VTSIDFSANAVAQTNVLLHSADSLTSRATRIKSELSGKYQAITCFAGGWVGGSVDDAEIFSQYEQMMSFNLSSALLTAHLASHFLSPGGLLLFTGAAAVFKATTPSMIGYGLAKTATHSLAMNMATRTELPETSTVVTILPETIDTPANRASMPTADFTKWSSPEAVAALVKMWAEGFNRPANGAFAVLKVVEGAVVPEFV